MFGYKCHKNTTGKTGVWQASVHSDVVSGGVSAVSLGCVWGVSGGVSGVSLGCVWDVSGVASGVSLGYLSGVSVVCLGCLWGCLCGVSVVSFGMFFFMRSLFSFVFFCFC